MPAVAMIMLGNPKRPDEDGSNGTLSGPLKEGCEAPGIVVMANSKVLLRAFQRLCERQFLHIAKTICAKQNM